jgi:hypothetical protein
LNAGWPTNRARFLDAAGNEVVRVDRPQPGAEVTIKAIEELQNKGDRDYFTDTMKLADGQIYLSRMELNQEHGQKQWDLPVVRAAVPVFGTNGQRLGIVIINMHFSHLADVVDASRSQEFLVYLTNDEGQFLLHPTPKIGFCFERKLDYNLDSIYPDLASFQISESADQHSIQLRNVRPNVSALIEPQGPAAADPKTLRTLVADLMKQYSIPDPKYSEAKDLAVLRVEGRQLDDIRQQIERDHKSNFLVHDLPPQYQDTNQAVYCRKIFFDERQPDRFIMLVLVLPY